MAGQRSARCRGDSWKRVVAWAGVIFVHLAVFVFLTVPSATHAPRAASHALVRTQDAGGAALVVRLIDVPSRQASANGVQLSRLPRSRSTSAATHPHPAGPRRRSAKARLAGKPLPHAPARKLDLSVSGAAGKHFVLGRDLTRGEAGKSNIRVPGGGKIAGAPHFEMVDPRSRGIAGVIHFIGSLTGAVDRHCLDLDAWQAMSVRERAAHGVSSDDIQNIQDNYNCTPPRRHG